LKAKNQELIRNHKEEIDQRANENKDLNESNLRQRNKISNQTDEIQDQKQKYFEIERQLRNV